MSRLELSSAAVRADVVTSYALLMKANEEFASPEKIKTLSAAFGIDRMVLECALSILVRYRVNIPEILEAKKVRDISDAAGNLQALIEAKRPDLAFYISSLETVKAIVANMEHPYVVPSTAELLAEKFICLCRAFRGEQNALLANLSLLYPCLKELSERSRWDVSDAAATLKITIDLFYPLASEEIRAQLLLL